MLTLLAAALAAPTAATVPVLRPEAPVVRLVVRFEDEVSARAEGGGLRFAEDRARPVLEQLTRAHGLRFRPLLADTAGLRALRARARAAAGDAPDLAAFVEVEAPAGADLEAMAHMLRGAEGVRYAYLQGGGWAPPGDIAPVTDDYSELQDWLGPDPGIDALAAHARGLRGGGVALADCEYGWNEGHEDLMDHPLHPQPFQTPPDWVEEYGWDQHGTAAVGAIVAGDNGYGALGSAPDATISTWPEYSNQAGERRVQAIADAIADALPGDVVMLEMQNILRPGGSYGPAELDPAVWEVVKAGTDAGVIVVAAAGNGSEDLDSAWYAANYLAWGDSGAILVGAGTPDTAHDRVDFSTYGSRVNLQGWGYWAFTPGYGDVYLVGGDMDQAYTWFSGTSSATPVVASAVLLVQDFLVAHGLPPLTPAEMRELLVASGHPQGDGGNIGPLPDVWAAMAVYDGDQDDHLAEALGGDDCDDTDADVHPDVPDEDEPPGVDLNCDGVSPEPGPGDTGDPDDSGSDGDDTGEGDEEPLACGCASGGDGAVAWGALAASATLAARRSHARRSPGRPGRARGL